MLSKTIIDIKANVIEIALEIKEFIKNFNKEIIHCQYQQSLSRNYIASATKYLAD